MGVRTVAGFYRHHWVVFTFLAALMFIYLLSALINRDYGYAAAGVLVTAGVVGFLWRRYDPHPEPDEE